jgi:PAS domain S-box-containing protein
MPRRHLRAVVDAVPSASARARVHESIVVTSADPLDPRIESVTSGFTDLTGYQADEVLGRNPRLLQGEWTSRAEIDRLRACLRSGTPFHGETWNYRKDGTPFLMRWTVEQLHFGEASRFVAAQRDMTWEAWAPHAFFRDSLTKIGAPHALVCRNGEVLEVAGELEGLTVGANVLDPHTAALEVYQRAIQTGEVQRRVGLNGPSEVQAHPLAIAEQSLGWVLTSLPRHEEQLERLASSMLMSENVTSIFAGIRHEMGNPVNSMLSALTVLRRQHETMAPGARAEYLDGLWDQAKRLDFLLRGMRGLTSTEPLQVEPLAGSTALDKIARIAHAQASSGGWTFRTEGLDKLPSFAADEQALFQVLVNLLSNAVDAVTSSGGTSVTLRVEARDPWVDIGLTDDGLGVSDGTALRLFRPFFTTKERGTGLGLIISRKLVERMGGSLSLANRSDGRRGAVATLRLPRSPGAPRSGSGLFRAVRG